ncbi:hypothetical protein COP2_025531 [Malus domestica]
MTSFDATVTTSCDTTAGYHCYRCRLYARTAFGTTLPLMHIALMVALPLELSAPHYSCRLLVHGRHQCIEDIGGLAYDSAAQLQRLSLRVMA